MDLIEIGDMSFDVTRDVKPQPDQTSEAPIIRTLSSFLGKWSNNIKTVTHESQATLLHIKGSLCLGS